MLPAVACLVTMLLAAASSAMGQTIDDCVRLALDRAPAMHGAMADTAAAAARVRAAHAAYWPRVFGQAQYGHAGGYDEAITNGGVTALAVALDAPLLDGGRRRAELAAARAHLQSAGALQQQRRSDVATTVREIYYTALAARRELATQRDAIASLSGYVALLQRQQRLGLAPATDVPRAELAVESARAAQRAANAALEVAVHELTTLTGSVADAATLVDPGTPPIAPATTEAIEASPAMVDALAAIDAARHEVEAARSERGAKLGFTGDTGFLGVDPAKTFRDNGGGQFVVGFTVPLFDGGVVAARVAAASAALASAQAKADQVRDDLTIALARARADAERAHADADGWQRVLPAAREALLLMRARYVGGAGIRLLEVLDAHNQATDADLAVTRAVLALRLALTAQARLLGRPEP